MGPGPGFVHTQILMGFGFIVLDNVMMHVHNFQEELFFTLGKVQAMEIVLEHKHISSSLTQFFIKGLPA